MADMVTIREDDLIESVADALQYISYFHPMDYIRALGVAQPQVFQLGKQVAGQNWLQVSRRIVGPIFVSSQP